MKPNWDEIAEHVAEVGMTRKHLSDRFKLSPEDDADIEDEMEKRGIVFCIRCGGSQSDDLVNQDGFCEICADEDDD